MSALVLASASPQREALLRGLGIAFAVLPSGVDESQYEECDPATRAKRLAVAKAEAVRVLRPHEWIVGCDTLVVSPDGELLEKPRDGDDAARMLRLQSGRTSVVHSGLCLFAPDGRKFSGVSSSSVRFRELSSADVDWWVEKGLWKDRSGSFQIDGLGQLLIEEIRGDWSGIVGFPVFLFGRLCAEAGAPCFE